MDSQREAKVVMAAVTKAQAVNSNKVPILGIAEDKHCDAEMARQLAPGRVVKHRWRVRS